MPGLYKRGRTYYCDLYIKGKRRRVALSTERKVAEVLLADKIKERDAARHGHALSDMPWPTFKAQYLVYSTGSKAPGTHRRDAAAIKALEDFEPITRLAQIDAQLLERWKGARRAARKGNATINRDLSAIKAMLRKAVEWKYLREFPGAGVKRLKQTRGRLIFWSVAELGLLLRHCQLTHPEMVRGDGHDWLTIAVLGARAGLRRGEIFHLQWDDVDLRRRVLSVTPKKGWDPKDYEQRHIPLPPDLVAHLASLKHVSPWVIGHRPSLETMSVYFARIVRKAGLRGSLHTARHTYASHLVQAGVDLYTVSKLLGHADITQSQVYAHLAPKTYEDAVAKLPTIAVPDL
jgi:integrase